jgi:hypothetical protein
VYSSQPSNHLPAFREPSIPSSVDYERDRIDFADDGLDAVFDGVPPRTPSPPNTPLFTNNPSSTAPQTPPTPSNPSFDLMHTPPRGFPQRSPSTTRSPSPPPLKAKAQSSIPPKTMQTKQLFPSLVKSNTHSSSKGKQPTYKHGGFLVRSPSKRGQSGSSQDSATSIHTSSGRAKAARASSQSTLKENCHFKASEWLATFIRFLPNVNSYFDTQDILDVRELLAWLKQEGSLGDESLEHKLRLVVSNWVMVARLSSEKNANPPLGWQGKGQQSQFVELTKKVLKLMAVETVKGQMSHQEHQVLLKTCIRIGTVCQGLNLK